MKQSDTDNLTPFAHSAHNRCFGCGPANPSGLQLKFLLAPDGSVVCPVAISNLFEGHPGYLHGGVIATLLDESMSKAVRSKGLNTMTRHLEIDYRRPVPSGSPLRLEGKVVRSDGRKHWAEAQILDGDGTALAQGNGLFVEVKRR
jgi:uncharacterized protein (TIGR00369 family)